jgi:hypothetical protein
MNTLKLAILASSMIVGAALADDAAQTAEKEMTIQVVVAGDGTGEGATINWTSNDPNMDLHNMQIGESQSIVDDAGRAILVTKVEEGLKFDVDGESVVIPDMGEHGTHMALISADGINGIDHDVDVQVIGSGHAMASPVTDGVMIITSEPLDAATQESIRAVLQSAGNNDEVTFIDGGNSGGDGTVRVVRKKVEIRQ